MEKKTLGEVMEDNWSIPEVLGSSNSNWDRRNGNIADSAHTQESGCASDVMFIRLLLLSLFD